MIVGITGRMGTGKTTLVKWICRHYSVSVIALDRIGHLMLEEDEVKSKLVLAFGDDILKQGVISRPDLANIVFQSQRHLQRLNKIVHPLMKDHVFHLLKTVRGDVLIEGALLYEIGLISCCDQVIVLDVGTDILMSRLLHQQHRLGFQRSQDAYLKLGDFVLKNTFDALFFDCVSQLFGKDITLSKKS